MATSGMADGDLEGAVIGVHGLHIGAGVPVGTHFDGSPLVGLINLVHDVGPFVGVPVSNPVKIIHVAAHHANEAWEATGALLLEL